MWSKCDMKKFKIFREVTKQIAESQILDLKGKKFGLLYESPWQNPEGHFPEGQRVQAEQIDF